MKFHGLTSSIDGGSSTVCERQANLGCGMECVSATLGRSSVRNGSPGAITEGKTAATAFERSLVLLLGRMFDHFKFGVIEKKSPDPLPEYRVQHWWHWARQGKLENLGKTDCLPDAWVDPETLPVSRSLES